MHARDGAGEYLCVVCVLCAVLLVLLAPVFGGGTSTDVGCLWFEATVFRRMDTVIVHGMVHYCLCFVEPTGVDKQPALSFVSFP